MSHEKSGFRSRSERQKDEALCCRYGRIGIPAVAAAQTVLHHGQPQTDGQTRQITANAKNLQRR